MNSGFDSHLAPLQIVANFDLDGYDNLRVYLFCRRNSIDFVDEIGIVTPMATIRKTQQTTSIYDNLRRRLTHGQLAPGSRLVEEKWALHLNVNRSALREALNMLAHEGLLESGAKGGFFVPIPNQSTLDEILEVRLAIEVGALRIMEFRQAIPAEGLAELHEICELMQRLLDSGFEYGFTEADHKFHEVLVEMAGNPRLSRVYRHAPLPITPLPETDEEGRRENMRQTLADHRELFGLLHKGSIPEATELLRRHLLVDHGVLAQRGVAHDADENAALQTGQPGNAGLELTSEVQ